LERKLSNQKYNFKTHRNENMYSTVKYTVGVRFSTPVQTGPGAHPVSFTMSNGSFPGVKRPGRGVDHPPHLAPRLKKEYS